MSVSHVTVLTLIPDEGVNIPDEDVNIPDEGVNIPDENVNIPDEDVNTYFTQKYNLLLLICWCSKPPLRGTYLKLSDTQNLLLLSNLP